MHPQRLSMPHLVVRKPPISSRNTGTWKCVLHSRDTAERSATQHRRL
jgi:hypothetical protein